MALVYRAPHDPTDFEEGKSSSMERIDRKRERNTIRRTPPYRQNQGPNREPRVVSWNRFLSCTAVFIRGHFVPCQKLLCASTIMLAFAALICIEIDFKS